MSTDPLDAARRLSRAISSFKSPGVKGTKGISVKIGLPPEIINPIQQAIKSAMMKRKKTQAINTLGL